jgi:hypothetical protein
MFGSPWFCGSACFLQLTTVHKANGGCRALQALVESECAAKTAAIVNKFVQAGL